MNRQIAQNSPPGEAVAVEAALPKVEEALFSTFKPIPPRPDFVTELRNRLQNPPASKRPKHSDLIFVIIISTGIATAAGLAAGMIWLASELVGALNVLRLNGRQR